MANEQKDPGDTFHILSLDGGGVRGVLPARLLANVEAYLNGQDESDTPLGQRFDLIAGTSTGGLIALGLAAGLRASEILKFYEKHIPRIFGKSNKRWFPGQFIHPKYGPTVLENALQEILQDQTLNDVVTDVCIPAVSLQNAAPRFYKSGYLSRNAARLDEKLVDIGLSTSAAPVFFPAHSAKYSTNLIDGGLCANNPAMVALVEAMQFEKPSHRGVPAPPPGQKRPAENITMLSLGTGEQCALPYRINRLRAGGFATWAVRRDITKRLWKPTLPLVETLMQSQSQVAHFQASFLLSPTNYLRVNPQLKFPMALDDAGKLDELKNLADMSVELQEFVDRVYLNRR
jgi:hypothetical protein